MTEPYICFRNFNDGSFTSFYTSVNRSQNLRINFTLVHMERPKLEYKNKWTLQFAEAIFCLRYINNFKNDFKYLSLL